jgi:hypothetical protein
MLRISYTKIAKNGGIESQVEVYCDTFTYQNGRFDCGVINGDNKEKVIATIILNNELQKIQAIVE